MNNDLDIHADRVVKCYASDRGLHIGPADDRQRREVWCLRDFMAGGHVPRLLDVDAGRITLERLAGRPIGGEPADFTALGVAWARTLDAGSAPPDGFDDGRGWSATVDYLLDLADAGSDVTRAVAENIRPLRDEVSAWEEPRMVRHDNNPGNVLIDGDHAWLIDFEMTWPAPRLMQIAAVLDSNPTLNAGPDAARRFLDAVGVQLDARLVGLAHLNLLWRWAWNASAFRPGQSTIPPSDGRLLERSKKLKVLLAAA
ncbi:MAG: hypothetical protein AAF656_06160 [Planctomycetota bacterium]